MPNHKVKLIVNPSADLGRAWRWASDLHPVVEEFGGADWSGTVYPTHATELARQAAEEGHELVIAVGGDGATHEVINGLIQVPPDRRPRLGLVPLGSGNDFAFAMGMNKIPILALRQVLTGKPRRVDVGLLRDNLGHTEYFNNTLGIGFDATVTIRSRNLPFVRGFMMYLLAVLQTIALNHDPMRLQVSSDQETWEDVMLMFVICNGAREGGGFTVAPDARLDDGIFHYAAVQRVSRLMMLRLVPEVMRGTHGRFRQVRMGQFQKISITSDRPLYIHTDGEIYAGFGMDLRQLTVENIPGALEIMV